MENILLYGADVDNKQDQKKKLSDRNGFLEAARKNIQTGKEN